MRGGRPIGPINRSVRRDPCAACGLPCVFHTTETADSKTRCSFMKQFAELLTAAVLACAWTTSASADPVTITFEQPPCAPLASGVYPGDCFTASGVTFFSD